MGPTFPGMPWGPVNPIAPVAPCCPNPGLPGEPVNRTFMLKVHRQAYTTLLVLYCLYLVGCCRDLGAEVVYTLGVVGVEGVIPRRG